MAAMKKGAMKAAGSAAAVARRGLGEPPAAPAGGARKGTQAAAKTATKASPRAAAVAQAARSRPKAPPAGAEPARGAAVGEGDPAPRFELLDQDGKKVSSKSLRGETYVLFFYPKDNTPGCTTEACGFRDSLPEFEEVGARVIGVSPDSVASHLGFARKHELPFTLLSDPGQVLATAYGVWALKKNYGREYMGIVRSTFLVDGAGVIRKAWRGVRVNGHVAEVQAAAASLG